MVSTLLRIINRLFEQEIAELLIFCEQIIAQHLKCVPPIYQLIIIILLINNQFLLLALTLLYIKGDFKTA